MTKFFEMILILSTLITSSLAAYLPCPIIADMDANVTRTLRGDFNGLTYNYVLASQKKYVLGDRYRKQCGFYYNFKPRPDDVYLVSFPSAGQFWVGQVIWLLMNNMDFKGFGGGVMNKITLLEQPMDWNRDVTEIPANTARSPRFIRTYLPLTLIPVVTSSAQKIIYLGRNPKDTMLDLFDEARKSTSTRFLGDIVKFWLYFVNSQTKYTPFWPHIQEGFAVRNSEHGLFVYAEENPLTIARKIGNFLNKNYTLAQYTQLISFMATKTRLLKEMWVNKIPKLVNDKMNVWIHQNIGQMQFPNIRSIYA